MAKDLRFTLEVATRNAIAELKKAAEAAEDVGEELEGSQSAGKRFADAMRAIADRTEAELRGIERASAALGDALGEDFVAAANASGRSVQDMVSDLRAAGLAYEDVERDAEDLAAAIKRVDEVGSQMGGVTTGTRQVRQDFDGVNQSVGQSAETFQRGIGPLRGFTDELGGASAAGGVLGNAVIDAGEAVQVFGSQLGLSEAALARVAGVLGGLGLAVGAGAALWQSYRQGQENIKKATEEATGAIREQINELTGIPDAIEDIASGSSIADAIFGQMDDDEQSKFIANLSRLGVVVDDYSEVLPMVARGTQGFVAELLRTAGASADVAQELGDLSTGTDSWRIVLARAMERGSGATRDFANANRDLLAAAVEAANAVEDIDFDAVVSESINLVNATDEGRAAMTQARLAAGAWASQAEVLEAALAILRAEQDETAESAEDHADAIDAVVSSVEKAIQAHKDETAALEEQQRKTDELIAAKREMIGGELGVRSAQNRANAAIAEYEETLADAEATTWDKSDADIAAREALINAAQAATEWEVAQREAAGETVTAAEQSKIFAQKLGDVMLYLAENSSLRVGLQNYINQLNSIPAVRDTVIRSQYQSVGTPGGPSPFASYAPGVGNTTINVSVTAPYGSNPVEFGRRVAEALTAYRRAGGISANTYF